MTWSVRNALRLPDQERCAALGIPPADRVGGLTLLPTYVPPSLSGRQIPNLGGALMLNVHLAGALKNGPGSRTEQPEDSPAGHQSVVESRPPETHL